MNHSGMLRHRLRNSRVVLSLAALLALAACEPPFDPDISYPAFSGETQVTVTGWSLHAMEPFISRDGAWLFFNSLNDGKTTALHCAARVSDTEFSYQGPVAGANQETAADRLDAVASLDRNGAFYWISSRQWPEPRENVWTGVFSSGTVSGAARVLGDFYIDEGLWIIMDAEIYPDGGGLLYTNTRLNEVGIPQESRLGLAAKNPDGSFTTLASSDNALDAVSYADHLVYAPSVTEGAAELYFTRVRKGTEDTQICVSLLQDDGTFSLAKKLEIAGDMVEAPSITPDGSRLYYHKRLPADGRYHIFTMIRQ